jgi:outer membrane protein TolC
MNLFSGFQTNTKVAKAQINKEMAITQKMLVTQSLKNSAENVLLRMKTAKLQIESSQSTVKQAQRAYEISKIRFNEGVGSQIEMNDADLALRQATINYLNASYNYLSARSEYENLIGNIQ